MKIRYECDFCGDLESSEQAGLDHEKQCCKNPACRTCETCKHHDTDVAGNGKVWNLCEKNLVPMDFWKNNFKRNCEGWEPFDFD